MLIGLAALLPSLHAAEVPLVSELPAFIADLRTAGYVLVAVYAGPRGGEPAGPPSYLIRPPAG